jgi:hypothetical protein
MRLLRNFFRRVRGLVRAETIHREIDEEARFHIEMRIGENIRRGMSPEEARQGADRGRYRSAEEMQCFSGIAPVTKRSGKTTFVQRRLACPKFVRQSFHEFAKSSIPRSRWARAYYDQQRQRGNKFHEPVRSLAYKWIRIIYQCWQQRVPYNEAVYLTRLELHGSLLAQLVSSDGRKNQELS